MGIFLSYRRVDSQEVVGRMYDRLITHFPIDRVLRDLDSLPLGKPFPQALDEVMSRNVAEAQTDKNAVIMIRGKGDSIPLARGNGWD